MKPRLTGGYRDHVVGAAIGGAYVALLLATARSLGFARDEGFYFRAATDYARWFRLLGEKPRAALERAAIDSSWSTNHEHPSLMKSLFSFSWMALHEKWHVFSDASTAFRFPAMLMAGMTLWVVYVWGARFFSPRAGAIAALLLALMPRVFYHAHLACFDVPIMAMWTWCVYVWWRSVQTRSVGWAIALGVLYGLTLETKHNAWILPAVFVAHAAVAYGRPLLGGLKVGRLAVPLNLVAVATIGPLVFWCLWPWIWSDTLPRLQEYVDFHMNHVYYNMEFLHRNYFDAPSPRSYALVMIAATVPTITLALAALGAWDRARRIVARAASSIARHVARVRAIAARLAVSGDRDGERDPAATDLLLFLALAAPLAPFLLLTHTPIFGGTKHWFPAYPFVALFAGRGFDLAATALGRAIESGPIAQRFGAIGARGALALQAALGAAVVGAPLAETLHSHPFGLSAYVPVVGGTAGGADMGLNRQFWGFTTESLAPYLEKVAPRGASIFIHDTAWDAWARLVEEGRIRGDLRAVFSVADADIAIVHHELHMAEVDHQIWVAFGTTAPSYVLTHDGVPIISVYLSPRLRR